MVSYKKLKNIVKYSSFVGIINNSNFIFASGTSAKENVKEIKKECEKLIEEIKKINGSCSISIPDKADSAELSEIKKNLEDEKKSIIEKRNALIYACKSLIAECKKLDSQFNKIVNQNDTITNLNNFKAELDKDLKDLKDKDHKKDKPENPEKDKDPKKNKPENPEKEFAECVELLENSYNFSCSVDALYKVSEDQLDNEINKLMPEYKKIINFEKKLKEEGKTEILNKKGETIINENDLSVFFEYYHSFDDIKTKIKNDKEEKAKKEAQAKSQKEKEEALKKHIKNLKEDSNVGKDFEAFFKNFNSNQITKIAARDIKEITEDNVNKYINLFKEKVMVHFEDEYKIQKDEDFKKYLERIEKYATKFFTEYDDNVILDNNRFTNSWGSKASFYYFKLYFELYIDKKIENIISYKKED